MPTQYGNFHVRPIHFYSTTMSPSNTSSTGLLSRHRQLAIHPASVQCTFTTRPRRFQPTSIDILRQLFSESQSRGGNGFGGCDLVGFSVGGSRRLANLGSIIIDGIAIALSLFLIWRSNRKRAAVGRRYLVIVLLLDVYKS